MGQSRPVVYPLHELPFGKLADCFALLVEKIRGLTRDGKPFYSCRFRDRHRSVSIMVWGDHPLFADCERFWDAGGYYKIRGVLFEHERYGLQVELQQCREVNDEDRDDGFDEADFFDHSRFKPEELYPQLIDLVEAELHHEGLKQLVFQLLEEHKAAIFQLPAHPRAFYPFPGGWLEHTLNVCRHCLWMTDRYLQHYPELKPPLNRDLLLAGAALHEIGRAVELVPGLAGSPPTVTVPGLAFGHSILGRDLVRQAGQTIEGLSPELLLLLEHLLLTHLTLPEWGSPRLPIIPEVLILHHVDDLDAKMEMYVRCLTQDRSDGPFTERDPVLGKALLKEREQ